MSKRQEISFNEYRKERGRCVTPRGSALFLFDSKKFPLNPLPDGPKQNEDCLHFLSGASLVIAQEALKQGFVVHITDRCTPWNNGYTGDWDFSLDVIAPEDLDSWR